MDTQSIYQLVEKYLQDNLSASEKADFNRLLDDPGADASLHDAFLRFTGELDPSVQQDIRLLPILETVLRSDRLVSIKSTNHLKRWMVAASIILVALAGTYFLLDKNGAESRESRNNANLISAGAQGAILTLGDGATVLLDSIRNGVVALQGGVTARVVNGSLTYEGRGKDIVYNTMSTPRGRQFNMTLPDGTRIWLNSESSIRFPVVFTETERRVEVTGEVYFQVAKKSGSPFVTVVKDRLEVQVLGTEFNLNAYQNEESIEATLINGSVNVRSISHKQALRLGPGQQAKIDKKNITMVQDPNLQKVLAWKNGLFYFDGVSLKELMRQVERWYDVEVVFEEGVKQSEFEGEMTRGVTLNQLLEAFQEWGVHCRLEGRKLIVQK